MRLADLLADRFAIRRRTASALLAAAVAFGVAWLPQPARAAFLPTVVPLPAKSREADITVMTLNVFGLPWPVGRDVEARCRATARFVRAHRPDVAALQEVWDETARLQLQVEGYHAAWCDSPHGLCRQSGLLTLSRLPLLAVSHHTFTTSSGLEALVGKGALRTVVALPDGTRLAIWNVHLQSGLDHGGVRAAQLRELAGWMRETDDHHRMLAGDLNCHSGDPEWRVLVEEFLEFGLLPRSGDLPTYDHRHNPLAAVEPPATIDHVFVDRALHAAAAPARRIADRPQGGAFLSDHFGLEVCLPPSRANSSHTSR